ncbi:MAG TPA: polyprenol monophosphomannose synthase [Chloroflexota bacterium]|nr:polyprenol monophosphomannose synthase [Chloroflexota bacterium]
MSRPSADRVLVVLPTYNERENLEAVVTGILKAVPHANLWIVDDASPDGTGELADTIAGVDARVSAFHRPAKAGLGTAYIESFSRALEQDYELMVEMDADLSHDPQALPEMLADASYADLVLGSRYVPGGSTPNWSLLRRTVSHVGNIVARTVLGLPVHDATTGYRVFRRQALERIHLQGIRLQGYGFQIETVYQCHLAGLHIHEHPIRFEERRQGRSKMSKAIVAEALIYVFRRRFEASGRGPSVIDQPDRVGDGYDPAKETDGCYDDVEVPAPAQSKVPVDQLE